MDIVGKDSNQIDQNKKQKLNEFHKKVSVPFRGSVLRYHLMQILADRPFSTQGTIDTVLKEKNQSARNKRLRETMWDLIKLNCLQNYKIIYSDKHECKKRIKTKNYFVNVESLENYLKKISNKKDNPKGQKTKLGFITKKINPRFHCAKCKKPFPYKENQSYKIGDYLYWNLNLKGILYLLASEKLPPKEFHKHYRKYELFDLLCTLQNSEKKMYVNSFTSNLIEKCTDLDQLVPISDTWLKKMKSEIITWKIKVRFKHLKTLQTQFDLEQSREKIFSNRSRRF